MQEKNIIWQKRRTTYENRCEVLGQKGFVIWFTGLSGSGKSTIAVELEKRLNKEKKAVYLLDGDNIRHGISSDLGFGEMDRNENIRRIGEIASLFQDAGIITLVSFISPFESMRKWAKEKIGTEHFIEIFVKADVETCKNRDPKGLYKKQLDNFTGITAPYEVPTKPDLTVDTMNHTVEECVLFVLEYIYSRGLLN